MTSLPAPLDAADEALLLALERDARASVVALARLIGLSRSATQARLARLERTGVVAGYTVRRGAHGSAPRLRAWLTVGHGGWGAGGCARTVARLRSLPEVRSAYSLAGETDLLVEVSAADVAELDRVRAAVEAVPGVKTVATHVVLSTWFEHRDPEPAALQAAE